MANQNEQQVSVLQDALAGLFGKDAKAAQAEEKARAHWAVGGAGWKSIYGNPDTAAEAQAEREALNREVAEAQAKLDALKREQAELSFAIPAEVQEAADAKAEEEAAAAEEAQAEAADRQAHAQGNLHAQQHTQQSQAATNTPQKGKER